MKQIENIQIRNFLTISNADITLEQSTILLGPQASGKSIIARLVFFCREYLDDLIRVAALSEKGKPTFDKEKRGEFSEIFPRYSWDKRDFSITYTINDFEITISHKKNRDISIKTSETILKFFSSLKMGFKKFKEKEEKNIEKPENFFPISLRYQIHLQEEKTLNSIPNTLFVPANRAIFSLLEDRFFTILDMDSKFDKVITNFGRFYETAKGFFVANSRSPDSDINPKMTEIMNEILCGSFKKKQGDDFIESRIGDIELKKASSGQQEVLPLLMAIFAYPRARDQASLLIVEEPEAHLFPTAQKKIVDLIECVQTDFGSRFLLTTHSPYFTAYFNNKIARRPSEKFVSAYFIDAGVSRNLIDNETNLIDLSALDEISIEIMEDFEEAINEGA